MANYIENGEFKNGLITSWGYEPTQSELPEMQQGRYCLPLFAGARLYQDLPSFPDRSMYTLTFRTLSPAPSTEMRIWLQEYPSYVKREIKHILDTLAWKEYTLTIAMKTQIARIEFGSLADGQVLITDLKLEGGGVPIEIKDTAPQKSSQTKHKVK